MPQAHTLQYYQDAQRSQSSTTVLQTQPQLEIRTPSSTLRQHVDPEALPRPDYFDSLDDLHLWYQMLHGDALQDDLRQCDSYSGPSRRQAGSMQSTPKLVVCHDFQGGYNEDPRQQGYSLEHMHLVDTFIYFSHKRVSIPPVGWLTAAARTGTKVLGTLLFEWEESVPDMARLLRGPERKAMPLLGAPCFSPQYAIELIELALEHGFSGFLVNVEVSLDLGFSCSGEPWSAWVGEQARIVEMHRNTERLRGWMHFLRDEGTRRFIEAGRDADEWEVMWYDSVVYPDGQLAWQDALNEHNYPFFQSAHTFFTNYTWARPPQPLPPGQLVDLNDESPQTLQLQGYGLSGPDDGGFHPQLLLSASTADSVDRPRQDVYIGIDVFGRNCWGGLKAWKSFDMIGPQRSRSDLEDSLGLSVALFAPGWTWEEESAGLTLTPSQVSQKRTWFDWWHIDSAFWIGVSNHSVQKTHRIKILAHEVKPVQSYFSRSNLASDRLHRRADESGFYTNFSFGSGTKWFDSGQLVHDWSGASGGFTDMGVCMPKPDLFYAEWHDIQKKPASSLAKLGGVTWTFDHERIWSGNSSFVVSMTTCTDSGEERTQWVQIPLCSAAVSGTANDWADEWQYTVVYDANDDVEIDPCITVALLSAEEGGEVEVVLGDVNKRDLAGGWRAATVSVRLTRTIGATNTDPIALSLGISPRLPRNCSATARIGALQLCKASCHSSTSGLDVRPASDLFGTPSQDGEGNRLEAAVLSWAPAKGLASSTYCNVWVQQVGNPQTKVWLGTSTREATPFEFCLANHLPLPPHLADASDLEYVVTSPGILQPVEIAKAPAKLL